jgi:hypothetical protein
MAELGVNVGEVGHLVPNEREQHIRDIMWKLLPKTILEKTCIPRFTPRSVRQELLLESVRMHEEVKAEAIPLDGEKRIERNVQIPQDRVGDRLEVEAGEDMDVDVGVKGRGIGEQGASDVALREHQVKSEIVMGQERKWEHSMNAVMAQERARLADFRRQVRSKRLAADRAAWEKRRNELVVDGPKAMKEGDGTHLMHSQPRIEE